MSNFIIYTIKQTMRIVDIFILHFVIFMTLVYVYSKPVRDYETNLFPDEIIRLKKRNADSSKNYLEQCGKVKFPNVQQGVVNVLAFLDSSWPYSHRQAIMLKMLNERLRRSGLLDTLFFVVNVDPSYPHKIDTAEDDLEREAWLGVSPDEIERFSEIFKTTDSLAMSMNADINLIQDNEDLGIWKELRGSRDQVLIIDRCGKLTYQVIVPWSILHFPYVKAAILSTYKDEPCGPCSFQLNELEISTRRVENDKARMIDKNVIKTSNIPENLMISMEYQDNTNLEWSTNESPTTKFLESLDIKNGIDAIRYHIVEENYSTTESSMKKYEESTTLMMTIDSIHDTENAHTTNVYTGIIDNTIDTLMDRTTEEILGSQTINGNGVAKKSNDSKTEKNLLDREDKNVPSVTITDTIDTLLETTTEKTLHIQTVKVLEVTDKSNDSKNQKKFSDQEDKNVIPGTITEAVKMLIETDENLRSETIEVLGVAEQLNDTKNEKNFLDHEDKNASSVGIADAVATLIETTTEQNLYPQTVKVLEVAEKSNDSKNQMNLVDQEGRYHDTIFIIETTIDTLINTTTNENVAPQTMKVIEMQSIDLKDEKISLDQEGRNDTNIIMITTMDTRIDTTPDDMYNFPSTRIIQSEDKLVDSKMDESASIESATDDNNYNPTAVNSITTNEQSTMNTDKIYDIVDTTTEGILDSSKSLNENHAVFSDMPIRIIMHAPHFHADGDSTRMHEYLVLDTGSPTNHDHLTSHDASRLYRGPQDYQEKMENLEGIENKKWSMKNLIYNKDESTGLYGEVADYWRDLGSFENYEDDEETERPEGERIAEEASTDSRLWNKSSKINTEKLSNEDKIFRQKSILSESKGDIESTEKYHADFTNKNVERPMEPEEFKLEEEERRNKLIAHYSKLLPWIYYVLDK